MVRLEAKKLQHFVLAQPAAEFIGMRRRHYVGAPIRDHGLVAVARAIELAPRPDREGDRDRGVELVAHRPGVHVGEAPAGYG